MPLWCVAVLMGLWGAEPPEPYAWPLDLPRKITSSFGEYRGRGFHAGIDLRTGEIGKSVYAPADGYVSRVRCSPWGYGKAIYLELDNGYTIVFGHLDDMMPALRHYVRAAQHAKQSYTVDLYPAPEVFPVRRGDIIAASGQTGIGEPHLHYEIRDTRERPTSPKLLGVDWPDTTRPVIRSVVVVPEGPDASVNGDWAPAFLDVRPGTEPGEYVCDAVRVSGRIGFGADVLDPANEGTNRLGIRVLRGTCDGNEWFCVRMDRFSYEDRSDEAVAYHPFFKDRGHFLLLWRWPGNACEIFGQSPSNGWLEAPSSETVARIEALDFHGNRAVVTIPLVPIGPISQSDLSCDRSDWEIGPTNGIGRVEMDCLGLWFTATARFPEAEAEYPEIEANGAFASPEFRRVNGSTFRAGIVPDTIGRELLVRVRHPRLKPFERRIVVFHRGDLERTVELADGVSLRVKPDSPYGVLFAEASRPETVSPTPGAMRGPAWALWPADSPIDASIEVSIPVPADIEHAEHADVYRDRGSGWSLEHARRDGDRFTFEASAFGTFAVLEDTTPPAISDVEPDESALASRLPHIAAHVSDACSGVSGVTVTCNGEWLLVGYDPERGSIVWERDRHLPEGPKSLTFTVTDRAGNTTSITREYDSAAK